MGELNASVISDEGATDLTKDEFADADRIFAEWGQTRGGAVSVMLRNDGTQAATCSALGTLLGPSYESVSPSVADGSIGPVVPALADAILLPAKASDNLTITRDAVVQAASRVGISVSSDALVIVQVDCTFTDGSRDSVSSDVYAIEGSQLTAVGGSDNRRAWVRDGLPKFDPAFAAAAEAYAPGLWAELESAAGSGKLGGAMPASVVSKYLCFQQPTTYQHGQSGVGEDVWPEITPTNRAHSFGLASVDGVWWGWLSVYGCTPLLNISTGTHSFQILSLGQLGSTAIRVGNYNPASGDGCEGCTEYQDQTFQANVDSSSVQVVTYAPTGGSMSKLNIYPAISLAMLENNGSQYEYRVQVKPSDGTSGSATNTYSTYAQIRLAYSFQDNKMSATHELGHATQTASAGVPLEWFTNCAYSGSNPPCSTDGTGHYFNSIEFTGCAVVEGFGNFFSAATWNTPTVNADCFYESERDCAGSATYAQRYMKSTCGGSPWNGLGVEWDWTRAFWDVLTHTSGGTQPTMNNIRTWLAQVKTNAGSDSGIDPGNAYAVFDGAANTVGGALNSVWDAYKVSTGAGNGVDVANGP